MTFALIDVTVAIKLLAGAQQCPSTLLIYKSTSINLKLRIVLQCSSRSRDRVRNLGITIDFGNFKDQHYSRKQFFLHG